MKTIFPLVAAISAVIVLCGCASMYYSTMEQFGLEKRDILVKRVDKAKDAQEGTQQTFKDALEQFDSVVKYDGGDLQKQYDKMSSQLERCENRAREVAARIADVERVAKDLFTEWARETKQYQNAAYRRDSENKLNETKTHYGRLIAAMRHAESRIEPVLVVFRDQTLYLKHNLNAKALASLQDESEKMSTDVNALIKELSAAIAEADRFINAMEK
jgi:DNA-directed RNA polymerase subunit F